MNHVLENKLKFFLESKKIKNILIITGQKSFNFSGFKKLEIYKKFKSIMTILYKKNKIPEIQELEYLIKKINIINPDLIIALGGGCVIDYAKLANGLYNIKNLKKKIKSSTLKVNSKKTKILAIPTTAGSGAEVTKFSVIYINKIKYSVEHNFLKPDFFSLIPSLVENNPKKIKGSSIFDCIAQAIESIFSLKSDKKSVIYATESLKISLKYYFQYYKKPHLSNCKKMLLSSNYAGKAIDISRTIASHAISYPFTSIFNISHGKAVAISFVNVLKYNYDNQLRSVSKFRIQNRFKLLFALTKTKNIEELINYLQKIILNLRLKIKLNNSKINFINNWPKINKGINAERLINNPVSLSNHTIKIILKESC